MVFLDQIALAKTVHATHFETLVSLWLWLWFSILSRNRSLARHHPRQHQWREFMQGYSSEKLPPRLQILNRRILFILLGARDAIAIANLRKCTWKLRLGNTNHFFSWVRKDSVPVENFCKQSVSPKKSVFNQLLATTLAKVLKRCLLNSIAMNVERFGEQRLIWKFTTDRMTSR